MTSPNTPASTSFLFLGDSLIADNNWQSRIPLCKVYNCGVSGSTAQDLLDSLPDIGRTIHEPAAVLIMIGTNDILSERYSFVDTIRQIIVRIRKSFPSAEIIITSLLPMRLPFLAQDTITGLNSHIEAVTIQTGCCYLDIHKKFLQSKNVDLFQEDGVHLTSKAYELWTRSFLEHVSLLIEND